MHLIVIAEFMCDVGPSRCHGRLQSECGFKSYNARIELRRDSRLELETPLELADPDTGAARELRNPDAPVSREHVRGGLHDRVNPLECRSHQTQVVVRDTNAILK